MTQDRNERRRGPQGERGPSGGEAVTGMLEAPLRAVKGAVSGDEEIWYERPEWMPHEVWAATQVAGDLVLDPLNLVGAGLFSKGKRMLDAVGASRTNEGMVLASPSNYLDRWYNPGFQEELSLTEDLLKGPAPKPTPKEGPQFDPIVRKKRKLQGAIESLAPGAVRGAIDQLSPKSRALWKSGISPNSQRLVGDIIKRAEGKSPLLTGTAKKAKESSRVYNPDYPVPFFRQPKFDRIWNNENWRKGYLKDQQNLFNQSLEEGIAQMTYNSHIIDQSGMSVPEFHRSMAELRKRISVTPVQTYEPGTLSALWRDAAGEVESGFTYKKKKDGTFYTDKQGKRVRFPTKAPREQNLDEAKVFEDHVVSAWDVEPGNATITIKPAMGDAGKHYSDVVYNNPANSAQVNVIKNNISQLNKNGKIDMDTFQKSWAKAAEGQNWKIKGFDEDGVYITGSKTGSAIVEGGVNYIAKYRNDGTMSVVMSDRHDFLETLPFGVGKLLGKLLPKTKIAVTPVMETDIFRVRPAQFEDVKRTKKAKPNKTALPLPEKNEQTTMELLKDYASAKPREDILQAENMKQAGMLSAPVIQTGQTYGPQEE